jgi:hypothetical protein
VVFLSYAIVPIWVLLLLLAVHHFAEARRGLRTGSVEGLMLGFWGKRYSRNDDGTAFWTNIVVGMFVAALGFVTLLWGLLIIGSVISAYYGQPTL